MPQIPLYRQQTEVNSVPSFGGVDPSAAAAPAEAVARLGGQVAKYAEQRRQEFDDLRAEEAFNKLRERQMQLMLDPEKGFASVKSRDAVQRPLVQEYGDQFQQAQNEIASSLQSESQRRLFQKRAGVAGLEFKNALMRHVLNESNQYANEVYQVTLAVETNRAVTDWQNPYTIQSSLDRIDAAIGQRAKREGLAADATDVLLRDARSKVHSAVIGSALEAGNVGYAEDYLKLNGGQMNAMDLLKVKGMVTKEADTRVALGTATEVVQGVLQKARPDDDFGRLWNLLEQRESAGRQDAVSPKGAVGVAQVMPTTGPEAAKLAGLPWDEKRFRADADYNRRLGQAYFAKQLQTFGGSVPKALAAYNAGPGAVQKAVKAAKENPALGEGGEDWLALLPRETQDYVAAILPKYQDGVSGVPARPTLEQIHEQVRERIGTGNPERLKLAIDEATRQWKDADAARKQREDEALGDAFRLLEANGGRWDALPPSLKARVPADRFGSLREYASKVAKGQPVETDWGTYYALRASPALLQKTNLLALKPMIGDTEFKELARLQEELKSGNSTSAQTQLQTTHQRMAMRLNEMGVDPTPKPGDKNAKKVAQVWSLLDQRVRASETALGRKLKPEEMDNEIDRLFSSVEVKGKLWGTSTRRTFELTGTEQIVVPDDDRKQIMAALKTAGQPVTEERVLYFYKRARGLE